MDLEPGSYTITEVVNNVQVCIGSLNTLLGHSPLLVSLNGSGFDLTKFEIAKAESDEGYIITCNGGNITVFEGMVVVSQSVAEVWRFTPISGSNPGEYVFSIERATEASPTGWQFEVDGIRGEMRSLSTQATTNIVVGPLPCCYWLWKVTKTG